MARDDRFERYLSILGIAGARPGLASLRRIVCAQLTWVPFENVSKIYLARSKGFRGVPELDLYLDGIEQHRFGGTCYSNNHHLASLLKYVGFDASYCGADMTSGEDVHAVVIVRLDEGEYLVDVGYGAPFYEPMPRELDEPLTIRLGRDRFVLQPQDDRGCSRMEHHRDGRRIHGYLAKPTPRDLAFFRAIVLDSYRPTGNFMTQLRISRFLDAGSVELLKDRLVRSRAESSSSEPIADRAALIDAVVGNFGMPQNLVSEVVSGLTWPPSEAEV